MCINIFRSYSASNPCAMSYDDHKDEMFDAHLSSAPSSRRSRITDWTAVVISSREVYGMQRLNTALHPN